ncbi:MAG: hypothetical protein HY074_18820 [Deltaproteobacteria bacterium]|nr:hypothetical protein [Deltaproteobacteria bacterium]
MSARFGLGFVIVIAVVFSVPVSASEWYLVGQHYHTTTDVDFSRDPSHHDPRDSYRQEGIRELIERGGKLGLDAMIVTEHNSVATCFDSLFENASSKLVLICGEEWTTHKSLHLGLLNPPVQAATDSYLPVDPEKQRAKADVQADARQMIQGIHERARVRGQNSLVVVNHPGFKMYQPEGADASLGADAAEAIVPEYESASKTRMWWLRRLAEGSRMVALGGSDHHACQGWDCVKRGDFLRDLFSEPTNLVNADSNSAADVMSAIARGRVVALSNVKHGRLRIGLTGEFAGRSYEMGDAIEGVAAGDVVRIGVHISGAGGMFAVVYGLGESAKKPYTVLLEEELSGGGLETTLEVKRTTHSQAMHVELFEPIDWAGHAEGLPVAISNPIYF